MSIERTRRTARKRAVTRRTNGRGHAGSRRPRDAPSGPRLGLWAAVAAAWLALAIAAFLVFRPSAPPPHDHRAAGPEGVVTRSIGPIQSAPLSDSAGRVLLRVSAEVPEDAPVQLDAVPAGAPATLAFEVEPSGAAGGRPKLVAHHTASGSAHTRGGAHHDTPAGAERVTLGQSETLLFNRESGELFVPGGASGGHDAHGHSGSPGEGLAEGMPEGAAFEWGVKLPPDAAGAHLDPSGRWLVAGYPESGRIEVVDVVRRRTLDAIETGGAPAALGFEPESDRLWVADRTGERGLVVDVSSGEVAGELSLGTTPSAIAFDRDGSAIVVGSDGSASFVDLGALGQATALEVGGSATDVAFASSEDAFVVALRRGSLAVVPTRSGALGEVREVEVRGEPSSMRIAPDGRSAVVAVPSTDTLAVVDIAAGKLVTTIEAGDEPRDIAFLGRFALATNKSPEVTWVDLADPSKSNNIPLNEPAASLSVDPSTQIAYAPSPAEKTVYTFEVMMGRPMPGTQLGSDIGADVIVPTPVGLRAVGPGVWEQRAAFPQPGIYHLELRVAGRVAEFQVNVSPADAALPSVTPVQARMNGKTGRPIVVRFRVARIEPNNAEVVAFSSDTPGGVRQLRVPAEEVADGTFEATLVPREPGRYRVYLVSGEAGLTAGANRSGILLTVR